ncbi:DUF2631 domain-containing protein [Amycolatopsis tucumanensis]|uniref:DUF2631 domain-containing protein n=1 Tax=unclassified Amycolatopsis TaxID=2618356 RepID=UPI0002625DFE|nr:MULTISPECIES: DUF2631 domain-containing protein [Amycolatopsis]MCF6423170.1 DUF2631 domain-containing protein [Amycolatopsis tucumanensis]
MIVASKAVEKRQQAAPAKVDPRDEPSAEWGWHGGFPKGARIAGWVTVVVLLAMIYNNHENNTENVWLVGIAAGIVIGLLLDIRKKRTAWRR